MSIESVMPCNHLVFCYPFLFLPSVFSSIKVFSNELALHIRWSSFWNFSFSISPSNVYSELISCRIDWFDLLAFQRNLKSLLQHYNWKVSILCIPPPLWFNPHIHTWLLEKNIALNRWSLVGKVIYLLSNMLSSFAIIFLLRSKCLLILWLQSLLWFWSPRK